MTGVRLYLRSRRVPAAAASQAAAVVACWATAWGFGGRGPAGWRLVVLTVTMAAACAGTSLAGPDPALDRTAARRWPHLRLAHLAGAAALAAGLVLATSASPVPFGPAAVVLRDVAGLLGLTALGAALGGVGRAWYVPVAWSLAVIVTGPQPGLRREVLTWMSQPASSSAATVTAVVLALAGAAVYVTRGERDTGDRDD